MRWLICVCLVLALWTPVAAADPIQATWSDQRTLVVTWAVPGWHCMYLVGGGHPDTLIPHSCQQDAGGVAFTTGGVDYLYTPIRRTAIVLRSPDGPDITLPIPPAPLGYRIFFPLMTR